MDVRSSFLIKNGHCVVERALSMERGGGGKEGEDRETPHPEHRGSKRSVASAPFEKRTCLSQRGGGA